MAVLSLPSHPQIASRRPALPLAAALYAVLLAAFWFVADHFAITERIGGHLPSAFLSFALLLAPYWFFGFGAADVLREKLKSSAVRALAPGLLVVPYLTFSLPRGEFEWQFAAVLCAIPIGLAALFEFVPPRSPKLYWQDAVALAVIGLPVEFRLLAGSFPQSGLSALPKFLLMDAALYAFLVVRRLDGVGYDFRGRWRDAATGLRELAFYAPIVLGLGGALSFISFHPGRPGAPAIVSALMVTFFFVAVPEELFFRGLLQNLLEARMGKARSLLTASVIFGLSHFNKLNHNGAHFNWRYVLLAAIAGIFYGRAWRSQRRIVASGTTHTLVDVIWGLWFKAGL